MALFHTPTCTRGLIIFFNFLFWVMGSGLILLGFWVLLDSTKPHMLHLLTVEDKGRLYTVTLAYTLFLIGCGMLGLVIMACCSLLTKPSLIAAYLSVLAVLECVELVAILVTLSCRGSMLVDLDARLLNNLILNYGHKNNDNINSHGNNVFTLSFDYTQYTFHCCGVRGAEEYSFSRWHNDSLSSKEPRNVPITCCYRFDDEKTSHGSPISVVSRVFHGTVEEKWQNPRVHQESDCQVNKTGARYNEGCLEHIQEWFLSQSMNLILILLLPMVLQLACIVFFVSLLRHRCRKEHREPPARSRQSSTAG